MRPSQPASASDTVSVGEIAFTTLLWIVAAGILLGGIGFPYPANLAPLLLGGVAVTLLTWQLGIGILHRLRPTAATAAATTDPAPATSRADHRHERLALAWTGGSVIALVLLGFLIGMSLAMVGLLRVYGRESWGVALVTTAGVIASLYVAFGVVLGVPFFPGLVAGWL